jgi:hypothetical protein
MPIASKGINSKKDYQKDSYNKNILMGKNLQDKNLLVNSKITYTLKSVKF